MRLQTTLSRLVDVLLLVGAVYILLLRPDLVTTRLLVIGAFLGLGWGVWFYVRGRARKDLWK